MTRAYYRFAIGCVVVFDLSRPSTFEGVMKWKNDVDSKVLLANNECIPVVLANKCDRADAQLDREKLDQFCIDNRFEAWFETSAQDDLNIDQAFDCLVDRVLEVAADNQNQPPNTVPLEAEKKEEGACGGCNNA
eukprot:TRINITY_DN2293_c1_g1_i1.p1 TRINITY_DN2293_c1_g1~~TRINITY_DN2293_c1_g1_i1.p1  ORF type:complete len:134 (+),score=46.71 TRINITY_DN2293_c1_g1_i1:310-711(+)